MTVSIIQLDIFNEIKSRLYNIKQQNGYFFDVTKVDVHRMKGFSPNDLPAINFYIIDDNVLRETIKSTEKEMTLIFEAYSKVWDNEKLHELYFCLQNDIEIAINRNTQAPLKSDAVERGLGGLVKSFSSADMSPIITGEQSQYAGIALEVKIRYVVDNSTLK